MACKSELISSFSDSEPTSSESESPMRRLHIHALAAALALLPGLAMGQTIDLPSLTFPEDLSAPVTQGCSQPASLDAPCPAQD
jgi:hypothetical protein